ncbi:MAG: malectin domain-containing carbohydrate-binding protein, partial [Phycisphaerae bacterium]
MTEEPRVSPDHTAKRRVMRILFCAIAGVVAPDWWPCPPASAQAAAPSYSRLSAHLIGPYTDGARQIVAAHPRVLKILDVGGGMLAAARDFKSSTPDGKLLLRVYTPRRYTLSDDPAASAQDFWNVVLGPAINSLSPSDRALIDYVEGPNEGDSTPTWASIQEAQWFNSFWLTLAPLIHNAGFRPCAFSIAVGNPPGDMNYIHQVLDTIVPALRLCKSRGGGWSYHSYTLLYTKDVGAEIWYSLRYRQYYNYFAQYYPDLNDLPLILTEGGVDGQAVPGGPGWKAYDAARYQDWLAWFDGQLMQDPYVVGCTLFQSGDTQNWFSFDLEPIAPWLAAHLATTPPPGPPAPPTSLIAIPFGPASAYLNWSATADTDRYNVKRSATSGGPYVTIASPTTNSYTDTSLTTGATYYYVVSAVNPAGESVNSGQAGATLTGACAVNCGGALAGSFVPDACYVGGNTYSTAAAIDLGGLTDPAPEAVYRSERWASPSFTYTFAGFVAGAPCNVRLHFAEIYFLSAGRRRFNVAINGTPVLSEFDIVAAAGAANKGVIRSFNADADSSGRIIIQFSAGSADNPKSSGIEVLPLPPRAPSGLTAAPGNARVVLNWSASAGALR